MYFAHSHTGPCVWTYEWVWFLVCGTGHQHTYPVTGFLNVAAIKKKIELDIHTSDEEYLELVRM